MVAKTQPKADATGKAGGVVVDTAKDEEIQKEEDAISNNRRRQPAAEAEAEAEGHDEEDGAAPAPASSSPPRTPKKRPMSAKPDYGERAEDMALLPPRPGSATLLSRAHSAQILLSGEGTTRGSEYGNSIAAGFVQTRLDGSPMRSLALSGSGGRLLGTASAGLNAPVSWSTMAAPQSESALPVAGPAPAGAPLAADGGGALMSASMRSQVEATRREVTAMGDLLRNLDRDLESRRPKEEEPMMRMPPTSAPIMIQGRCAAMAQAPGSAAAVAGAAPPSCFVSGAAGERLDGRGCMMIAAGSSCSCLCTGGASGDDDASLARIRASSSEGALNPWSEEGSSPNEERSTPPSPAPHLREAGDQAAGEGGEVLSTRRLRPAASHPALISTRQHYQSAGASARRRPTSAHHQQRRHPHLATGGDRAGPSSFRPRSAPGRSPPRRGMARSRSSISFAPSTPGCLLVERGYCEHQRQASRKVRESTRQLRSRVEDYLEHSMGVRASREAEWEAERQLQRRYEYTPTENTMVRVREQLLGAPAVAGSSLSPSRPSSATATVRSPPAKANLFFHGTIY